MTRFTKAAVVTVLLVALSPPSSRGRGAGGRCHSYATAAVSSGGESSIGDSSESTATSPSLTFFDQDFDKSAVRKADNNNKDAKADKDKPNNNSAQTKLETSLPTYTPTYSPSLPTFSPTLTSQHAQHGTPLPRNCARQFSKAAKSGEDQDHQLSMPKACRIWLEKNPEFKMPSGSPTMMPSGPSPTMGPSGRPSPGFDVTSEVVGVVVTTLNEAIDDASLNLAFDDDDDAMDGSASDDGDDGNATALIDTTVGGSTSTTSTQTDTTIRYQVTPMDDTFLELYRPYEPLGKKDKLKIDATFDGSPTKVIQLKFGLSKVFEEVAAMAGGGEDTSLKLNSASLQLYALSDTAFGGYLAQLPSAEEWNEETAVWNDYVNIGQKDPMELLPNSVNDTLGVIGGVVSDEWIEADVTKNVGQLFDNWNGGRESESGGNEDKDSLLALRITTDSSDGVIYASKENPSGKGPVLELQFVISTVVSTMEEATTFNTTAIVAAAADVLDILPPTDQPTTMIRSPSPSKLGDTLSPTEQPTISSSWPPSKLPTVGTLVEPTPVLVRPFKTGQTGLVKKTTNDTLVDEDSTSDINDTAQESNSTSSIFSTSVVSSSFRMTITAIQTPTRRRNLLRAVTAQQQHHGKKNSMRQLNDENAASAYRDYNDDHPSIEGTERPAITQHLTRVYDEVLSIAPTSISLVFEEDLVVEELVSMNDGISRGGNSFDGVIRKSVFRVIAIFDDPEVSTIQSDDAARVLDQATIYAFVGPEEQEFIKVLKSTTGQEDHHSILIGPAEYDVTVLKVNFSVGTDGDTNDFASAAAANANNMGDEATNENVNDGEENASSSSSSSWLPPTFIAGASVLVFASSAAAFILWKQRHHYGGENNNFRPSQKQSGDNDNSSPRSLETVPSTPSPTVFLDRFKNSKKKKFDYAEFEDEDDERDPLSSSSLGSACDAVISPLTTTIDNNRNLIAANTTTSTSSTHNPRSCSRPTIKDIKFSHFQNVSFDDSSVSDVSAHILGAKGTLKNQVNTTADDPNVSQAESFLLDTTMESYNMEAMSALDQVRFENVLQVEDDNHAHATTGGRHTNKYIEDDVGNEDGSLSTGVIPSELYSNLSIDESHDTAAAASAYGGHLFTTMNMLRNKDSSLLEMPPPPSDAASDSSSLQDSVLDEGEEDEQHLATAEQEQLSSSSSTLYPNIPPAVSGIENAPMREKNEQDAVSQSINDELTKVMKLLKSPRLKEMSGQNDDVSRESTITPFKMDASVVPIGNEKEPTLLDDTSYIHIGNVKVPTLLDDNINKTTPVKEAKQTVPEKKAATKEVEGDHGAANAAAEKDEFAKYWRATLDASTGNTYYFHKKTKMVTWTKPEEFREKEPSDEKKEKLAEVEAAENDEVVSNNHVEDGLSGHAAEDATVYDGVNVLIDDESTDAEPDESDNDPLKLMNNTLSDCMDILEKARVHHRTSPSKSSPHAEDDELSLVTERID